MIGQFRPGGNFSQSTKTTAAVPNTVDFGTLHMSYETKYRIVDRAFRAILSDVSATNEALLVFLDALKEA